MCVFLFVTVVSFLFGNAQIGKVILQDSCHMLILLKYLHLGFSIIRFHL